MAEETTQSYKNHSRFDPAFHLVLVGLLLLALILSILTLIRHPGLESTVLVVLAVTLFWNSTLTRTYPLKVQDRIIRLEERLRLSMLLPEALRPRIVELTPKQLVALRFASDTEVPALVLRTLQEGLTNKQIKSSIQTWRADTLRV